MYTKEELEAMEIPQLMGIANELGINVSQNSALEDVIYAIIDTQNGLPIFVGVCENVN